MKLKFGYLSGFDILRWLGLCAYFVKALECLYNDMEKCIWRGLELLHL